MAHGKPSSTPSSDVELRIALDASFLSLPASGIGTYVRELSRALIARQHDLGIRVHLVEPGPGRFVHPGSRLHRFLWDALGIVPATGHQVGTVDVLHLPQMSAPLWTPSPFVVTIHDVIPFVLPDYRASRAMDLYLRVMSRTVRRARQIIAPSETAAADISTVLDIPPQRISVIAEAPDPDLTPSIDGAAQAFVAEEWGIEGPYLFNIGGFDRRKNLPLTIEAFAAALPQLPYNTRLVIAGAPHSGNERMFPPLEPIIRRYGLESQVILTGRVSHTQRLKLYQAAAAYVTVSEYEGFGLTPLEAMACGVPPIVANRTSLPEVTGDAGLIIEPTVPDLAQAMIDLLTIPKLHDDLARKSLARAATFTWSAAADQTAAVYRRAYENTRR